MIVLVVFDASVHLIHRVRIHVGNRNDLESARGQVAKNVIPTHSTAADDGRFQLRGQSTAPI